MVQRHVGSSSDARSSTWPSNPDGHELAGLRESIMGNRLTIIKIGVWMQVERRVFAIGEVLEALLTAGLVGLGEHDNNGSRVVGRFLSKHAVELRGRRVLGTLSSDVAAWAESDGGCIDVVVEAVGDVQLDAVIGKRLNINVAIAIRDVVTRQARPFRLFLWVLVLLGQAEALQVLEVVVRVDKGRTVLTEELR
jgi:hypothetical protein